MSETHFFHKPSVLRSRREIPPNGEAGLCVGNYGTKLKSYFQAHIIVVLMDKPLRRVMNSPEAAGWMALWAVELTEFDIQYCPRTAIKGQVMADFIAEFTFMKG